MTRYVYFLLLLLLALRPVQAQTDEELDRWIARAERFVQRGQWRRATPLLEKVYAADPEDSEAKRELLLCLEATGREEKLGRLLRDEVKAHPASKGPRVAWVRHLVRTGRADEALAALQRARRDFPDDYGFQVMEGALHQDAGRDEQAKALFDGVIAAAKAKVFRKATDLVALARADLFYPGGEKWAERALVDAQKADPKLLEAYLLLARVYRRLDLPTDSDRELKDALEIRKSWPEILVERARTADLRLGQAEDVKKAAVAKALKINPRHPDALFLSGMDAVSEGRLDEAQQRFERALEVNPRHKEALSGLAALAVFRGDAEGREALRKRVMKLDPTFGEFHRIVGEALSSRWRWTEALAELRRGSRLEPANWRIWDDLARYALYLGEEKEGLKALEAADAAAPAGRVWRNNMHTMMSELAENYETFPTRHFVLKLHKKEAKVLKRYLPDFVDASYDLFVERYGYEPKTPILFEVLRRHSDFSVRTMGTLGLGALGVCFGPTVMMDGPLAQKPGTYNWEATAHHEIAHVFTLNKSRNRVPRWLTEGLSSWEEVRMNPSWGRDMEIQLHNALHNGKILKVLEFDAAFRTSRIGFAYYQGSLVSRWIENTRGVEAIRRMLALYAEDKDTREVLKEALGLTPEAFDAEFLEFVTNYLAPMRRMPAYDDDSMARFKKALVDGKDVDEMRIRLAWGHYIRGRFVDMEAVLKPLLDAGSEDPRIELILGLRAAKGGRKKEARERFMKLRAAGFRDHVMEMLLVGLLGDAGRDDEAMELAVAATESDPWDASGWSQLARLQQAAGDTEGWAKSLRRLCDLVDTAVKPREELLKWAEKQGDRKAVKGLLDELLAIVPMDPKLHHRRGRFEKEEKRLDAALSEFECALDAGASGPLEFDVRLDLGRLLLDLDRADDASYHLDRALEIKPSSEEAKELLRRAERE